MKYESLTTAVHPSIAPTPLRSHVAEVLGWSVFWAVMAAHLYVILRG